MELELGCVVDVRKERSYVTMEVVRLIVVLMVAGKGVCLEGLVLVILEKVVVVEIVKILELKVVRVL